MSPKARWMLIKKQQHEGVQESSMKETPLTLLPFHRMYLLQKQRRTK